MRIAGGKYGRVDSWGRNATREQEKLVREGDIKKVAVCSGKPPSLVLTLTRSSSTYMAGHSDGSGSQISDSIIAWGDACPTYNCCLVF